MEGSDEWKVQMSGGVEGQIIEGSDECFPPACIQ